MRRILGGCAAVVLGLAMAGCHPVTVDEITTWSDSVYDWQNRTYQTICEIAAYIDPNNDDVYDEIGDATEAYCGSGDGGAPNNPPDWGA